MKKERIRKAYINGSFEYEVFEEEGSSKEGNYQKVRV